LSRCRRGQASKTRAKVGEARDDKRGKRELAIMDLADIIAILDAESKIVGVVIEPHGFVWAHGKTHQGHPGNAARGTFVKGDRQLKLGFRWSLGPVIYRIGSVSVVHEALMKYAGHYAEAEYPGFSTDPLDAFRHLAGDLHRFGGDFMFGDGATIIAASKAKAAIL
jgi:hypothetical protein